MTFQHLTTQHKPCVFLGIDPGFNHETGLLDCEIDFRTGTVFVLQERLIDYKNQDATIEDIEREFWQMVRARRTVNMIW